MIVRKVIEYIYDRYVLNEQQQQQQQQQQANSSMAAAGNGTSKIIFVNDYIKKTKLISSRST